MRLELILSFVNKSFWLSLLLITSSFLLFSCKATSKQIPPAKITDLKPTILLISIDGFRAEYLNRGITPNLQLLANEGVRSQSLNSVFPTKTFPNHYTIVTGLLPDHHGIISNRFYDPQFDEEFTRASPKAKESRWWKGEPIWVTAEKQGQLSGTFFWPGSEVEIQGRRPKYNQPYNPNIDYRDRIKGILDWLDLPVAQRPTLLTLYFEEVDIAGHRYGPDAKATRLAISKIDRVLTLLLDGLAARGIRDQINIIIVSDHGMTALDPDKVIQIDKHIDISQLRIIEDSPIMWVWPPIGQEEQIYQQLVKADPHLTVYRRAELQEKYKLGTNSRVPPLIAIVDEGWSIDFKGLVGSLKRKVRGGGHGYLPESPQMQGIFIAHGPAFKKNTLVPTINNTDIYELMAQILNLQPAANDGCLDCIRSVLASSAPNQ
jgi:predicted AlkP superfamily pyrophosphatase or phosphodiesterase